MDMRKLTHAMNSAQRTGNSSEPLSLTELPPSILDALVPGYSLISRYIHALTGIDISFFVSIGLILFAVIKGGQFLYSRGSRAFRYLFLSSVYIKQHDDLFDMTLDWMAKTQISTSKRRATAKTQRGPRAQNEFEATEANALSEDGFFDFQKWSARVPPRYEPYYGRHFMWHNRRLFIFHRSKRSKLDLGSGSGLGKVDEEDMIQIDCIGRTIEPIKELLAVAKVWSLNRLRGTTTIRHPLPKERQRFGGLWSKLSVRPSRPMQTVILDRAQKEMIVTDMNDYLHPASPQWYATRGLPYRRGYLFHGPPGTGKTSLSFALAGIFGLEIYVIGLQEPSLTEGDLMALFNSLPRRCVVLLEDVDAAEAAKSRKLEGQGEGPKGKGKGGKGNNKKKGEKAKQNGKANGDVNGEVNGDVKENGDGANKKGAKDEEFTLKDLAKELKALNKQKPKDEGNQASNQGQGNQGGQSANRSSGSGISLSGLLNAIDGVASHEGRVLIMTTNHPEQLDAALIRPGRVDRKIEFTYAMQEQIRELFVRMYSGVDPAEIMREIDEKVAMNGTANGHLDEKKELSNGNAEKSKKVVLEQLAEEFASHIPDATYTPAEIQNHLMRYKDEPRRAVEKVDDWIQEQTSEKERQQPQAAGDDDDDSSEE
ncbi:uncharacterized protein LTR77_008044 [Saxophila tyrrhenica]|uniref:P-loop containing nucleoside triphosphate hydrolase protein n=1 Tax=Saxophila tyrrhenica TaxID=1690608 RepID=A0AAV9P242_9PEZI|nr:hypothetical protein LTR77_008044 [Saxophila tyrrhenica]